MQNKEFIKCCPFCGSRKVVVCRTNENACWIRCGKCGADAPATSQRKRAIAIWNKRYEAGTKTSKIIADDEVQEGE